jgi:hypothetical protein
MILVTALVGVAGAVLGAYLNYRLPRAMPMVLIHSIELSTALVDPQEAVEKQSLIRAMKDFPYELGVGPIRSRMKMGEWLEYVSSYHAELEDLTADIDEVKNVVSQARQLVVAEDFAAARPKLGSNHFWWHMLEGRYRRTQEDVFSEEARKRLDDAPSVDDLIETDDDGDYLIRIEGGRSFLFDWHDLQPTARRNAAKQLARRSALALALNDKPALLELLDYVRQEIPQAKETSRQLTKSIETTLREYQHIVVTGLLMNAGRLVYLVDSQARLAVRMKGYPRRRAVRGGFRDEPLAEDAAIDMVVEAQSQEMEDLNEVMKTLKAVIRPRRTRTSAIRPRNVLAIGSTTPTVVRLVSEQRLTKMELSDELIRAYEGGERSAYLILSIIKPRQTEPQAWYSKDVPFRNVINQATLPSKKS